MQMYMRADILRVEESVHKKYPVEFGAIVFAGDVVTNPKRMRWEFFLFSPCFCAHDFQGFFNALNFAEG